MGTADGPVANPCRRPSQYRAVSERRLSIIVCTFNRARLLTACLTSLVQQSLPADHYEILVVDNGSTDETPAVARRWAETHPNVRAISEPRAGKSRASNTGLRHARGACVAFIDDDATAPPEWAGQILEAFASPTPPAVVLGTIAPVFEVPPREWVKHAVYPRGRHTVAGFLAHEPARYPTCGSNFAFDRVALVESGGFAEHHGPVGDRFRLGEDTEVVRRVAARFPRVWFDPAIVVHHWVPHRKSTLRYQMWRHYLSGVAVSQIEGLRLWSWQVPSRVLPSTRQRPARRLAAMPRRVVLPLLALRVATLVGMVRGAQRW